MNINLQDLLAIWGPSLMLTGFMWYHFNSRFDKIDQKFEKMDEKISSVEQKLGEKIDAVRDRVSRIEGQLAPTSVVPFNPPKHKAS
jgi:uncharacterized protein YdcH (DUF465 family)